MVAVLEHGGGMTETLLQCCSAVQRRAGERESESKSERVGEWRAKGSPFWSGRADRRRWTATMRHELPGHGRPRWPVI